QGAPESEAGNMNGGKQNLRDEKDNTLRVSAVKEISHREPAEEEFFSEWCRDDGVEDHSRQRLVSWCEADFHAAHREAEIRVEKRCEGIDDKDTHRGGENRGGNVLERRRYGA